MSNRTGKLVAAVAIALLALPAAAGSWPNISPRKAPAKASQTTAPAVATPRPIDENASGFEYIGGEGGWQPSQHKYVWSSGGFAHSDECDHAIRTAKASTAADLERNLTLYGGA